MHGYLDQHQIQAVEALFELKRICEKYDIRFFLLAGTTLGAVRHQGMIPWDDDIDVGLLSEDLEKLQAVIQQELDHRFEYVSLEVENGFPRLFGKILYQRQSCVDLFLIARWTTNNFLGNLHWQLTRFCVESYYQSVGYEKPEVNVLISETDSEKTAIENEQQPLGEKIAPRTGAVTESSMKKRGIALIRKLCYHCCFFLKPDDYVHLARWNEGYFHRNGFDCYINLYSIYGMKKERLRKEWIENPSYVTFEGGQFMTVGDTDAYLTHLYGDYMTLPPEEKRIRSRHAEVYVKKA